MPEPPNLSLKDKKFKFNLPLRKAQVEDDGFLYMEFALATTDVDLEGEQLTDKCLKDMVSQALGINVYLDHKYDLDHTVGPVIEAKVEGSELWVKARVRNELRAKIQDILDSETKMGGSFGGICMEDFMEAGVRKLDKVNLLDATFTPMPVNTATSGSAKESVKGCTVCNQIFKSLKSKYGIERNLEVKNVTRTEDESYEAIRVAVEPAMEEAYPGEGYSPTWIRLTFPDSVIYENWEEGKTYELPYSIDEEGNVTLGEPVEVQEQYVEKKLEVLKTKAMEHEPPADYKKHIGDESMDETKVQEMINKSNDELFDKLKGLMKPEDPAPSEIKAIDEDALTDKVTKGVLKALGFEEEAPEDPEGGKVMIIDAKAFEEMQADTIQKAIMGIAKQREGTRKSKSLGLPKFGDIVDEPIEPEKEVSKTGGVSTVKAAEMLAKKKGLKAA